MDFVFVIPRSEYAFSTQPYLGQGYIASSLIYGGFSVKILDFHRDKVSAKQAMPAILAHKAEFIGFTVYSSNFNLVKEYICEINKSNKNTKVLIGGPHVSALPEFSLKALNADFAIVGEGEQATLEIIRRCKDNNNDFNDIPGICSWNNGNVVINPGINIIEDLDELPFPAWELMPPREYKDTCGHLFAKRMPVASMITSRGCPHQCTFCAARTIHGTRFRTRSVENVIREIVFLIEHFGVKEINICDDTFTENREHAFRICQKIIELDLNIVWRTPVGVRLDTLDVDLLKVMRASGCYQLGFGIESFSKVVLEENKKSIVQDDIERKIKLVKSFGIETFGFFILGLPGETRKTIRETIDFIKKASYLDYVWITFAVPLPGTQLFNRVYKGVDLSLIDWDKFIFQRAFNTCSLDEGTLKKFFFWGFFIAYSKPKRLFLIIKNLRINKINKLFKFIFRGVICNIFK